MCAFQQMKAVVYRDVLKDTGSPEFGMQTVIAEKLTKIGGGSVTAQAVSLLFARVDADAGWYPGKINRTEWGPKPALNGAKRRCIAQAAMALKDKGLEPTYPLVVAQCPQAAMNPATKRPVGKKRVYDILREECYDDPNKPEDTWSHRATDSF